MRIDLVNGAFRLRQCHPAGLYRLAHGLVNMPRPEELTKVWLFSVGTFVE